MELLQGWMPAVAKTVPAVQAGQSMVGDRWGLEKPTEFLGEFERVP